MWEVQTGKRVWIWKMAGKCIAEKRRGREKIWGKINKEEGDCGEKVADWKAQEEQS